MKYPRLEVPHHILGCYYRRPEGLSEGIGGILKIASEMQGLDPSDARVYHDLGNTYMGLGLFPQAEGALLKALSLNSYYARYHDLEYSIS